MDNLFWITLAITIIIMLVFYFIVINQNSEEKFTVCNKDKCNIDTYNLKEYERPFPSDIGKFKSIKNKCEELKYDQLNSDKNIADFNDNFYGFYNKINNNSSQKYDTVDKINYNTFYDNNKISDVFNYLTSN